MLVELPPVVVVDVTAFAYLSTDESSGLVGSRNSKYRLSIEESDQTTRSLNVCFPPWSNYYINSVI